ncbi:ABC transporter permease [Oceanimonas doudoroffii]|uniref:ABC transporter permease n=1 Tax=Oceanimonas doudoroffii TaxID=84158 RepID=A0A233RH90_9GAMM|nr:ABC transporter permease [Oceanimonas doudoroffii]OXY82752.1 ABC transporter permease [Oceanimonas doudoroffii]
MMRVGLATLLSHYRRHPGQLAMLLLGLWVAGALWSGVQAINASARESYGRAEAWLGSGVVWLVREDGQPLTYRDFVVLRRAGVPVSPLLQGEITTKGGLRLTLVGMDPLTLPANSVLADTSGSLRDFIQPPWQVRLAPDTRAQLGDSPRLQDGTLLPPLVEAFALPPQTLVMDIAAAAQLLQANDGITALLIDKEQAAPAGFIRMTRAGPGELTESFHLNLTAMALLALIVGLFIVQAALGLALEQRLALLRTLRALGVPALTLLALLVLELLGIGLIGASAGLISGVWLAKALLPDVAATLQSLYGAKVSASLNLPLHYWLGGMGVTLGGLVVAAGGVLWRASRLPLLGLGQAQVWRSGFERQLGWQARLGVMAALLALVCGLVLWGSPAGEGLLAGFGLVAALLLAAALCLPPLLARLLMLLLPWARPRPLMQWALADMQLQLPRLSLAMMALLIALTANLGVSSMVGGFRLTFLDWLERRLMADLYLRPPPAQFEEIHAWLGRRPEVQARLTTVSAEAELLEITSTATARRLSLTVAVFGITPAPELVARWPLLASLSERDAAWQALRRGEAFINEQLARREGIAPGDRLSLVTPGGAQVITVAGIYPDYGNPRGELVLTTARVQLLFEVPPTAMGVVLSPGISAGSLRQALRQRFNLGEQQLQDQREVKAGATVIFERTFAITRALNALTLAVAALALLATLLAQAGARRRAMAVLWALGVSRRRLVAIQLAQLAGMALATGLLAVPLGVAVTACLVWGINVAAFGWRLPLHVFPGEMGLTLALAVLVALLAAALPMLKLFRTPPRALLAEDEYP